MKLTTIALLLLISGAFADEPTQASIIARYGDLFAASGKKPGNRTLTVGKKSYQMVQILGRDQAGKIRLKTKHGEIEVSDAELPADWASAVKALEAATPKAEIAAKQKELSIKQLVRAEAAKKWPGDYAMQVYEINRQLDGFHKVTSYRNQPSTESLVPNAVEKWPDDYVMQAYEIERQLKALDQLRK